MARGKRKRYVVHPKKVLYRLKVRDCWAVGDRYSMNRGDGSGPFYLAVFETEAEARAKAAELNA